MTRWRSWGLVAVLVASCAGERVRGPDADGSVDASGGRDGGAGLDASPTDAGADGGMAADAAPGTDAGEDGGAVADAGEDGGTVADAGADAAVAVDAGTDAGGDYGCPVGPCNLIAQTGCSSDEACYFVAPGGGDPAPTCVSEGSGGDGAVCTTDTDCAPGFGCAPAESVCRAYCCDGSDLGCPTGQVCATILTDSSGSPTAAGFCGVPDSCDPIEQTGCPAGDSCYPQSGGSSLCIESLMDLGEGAACTAANDCAGGLLCVAPTSGGASCHVLCDTGDGSRCGGGQTCESLGYSGRPEWGVCMPVGGS